VLWIGIRIRIGSEFNGVLRSGSGSTRAKKAQKNRKQFFVFKIAGCSPLRAEGFSFSLDNLYWGLGISKLQLLITKKGKEKFCCIFFQYLVIKTLDPYPDPAGFTWNAESGSVSGFNESGSTTLLFTVIKISPFLQVYCFKIKLIIYIGKKWYTTQNNLNRTP
jgi:hypothetical protein